QDLSFMAGLLFKNGEHCRSKKYLRWISKQMFGQSRPETGTLNLSRSRRRWMTRRRRPFGSQMPMQFSYAAGSQSHVDPRDGLGNCEIRLRPLTRPAAI